MKSSRPQVTGSRHECASDRVASLAAAWTIRTSSGLTESVQDSAITAVPYRIGRLAENDLRVADPTVSGQHAELFFMGDDLYIRDKNSTNGTFVNGNRITEFEQLRNGDLLQLGLAKMRVLQREQAKNTATVSHDVAVHAMAHFQFDELLDRPAVVPYLQPIVDLSDSRIVGFEILGRSRLTGLETPAQMFRVAAERNLECRLSRVLRREGVRIASQISTPLPLYVNTHPHELSNRELFDSLTVLRDENPHSAIVLEVHEAAVTSSRFLGELRRRLNDLNIGLAYDDFGAGQTRLVELSDVPPDIIKFDLQLVQGLRNASNERRQVVSALLKMVRDLGIIPLAEGIEQRWDADACRELGFEMAQGFYFGRPAPVSNWLPHPAGDTGRNTIESISP